MFRRSLLATAALALTIAPVAAQAAAQPAARTSTPVEGEQLIGTTAWILAAIALGLAVWGIVELTGDDEPASP